MGASEIIYLCHLCFTESRKKHLSSKGAMQHATSGYRRGLFTDNLFLTNSWIACVNYSGVIGFITELITCQMFFFVFRWESVCWWDGCSEVAGAADRWVELAFLLVMLLVWMRKDADPRSLILYLALSLIIEWWEENRIELDGLQDGRTNPIGQHRVSNCYPTTTSPFLSSSPSWM